MKLKIYKSQSTALLKAYVFIGLALAGLLDL